MIEAIVNQPPADYRCDIVLLHGYAMSARDLAPFAASLGLPGRFIFPQASILLENGKRAWWPAEHRSTDGLAGKPRDLAEHYPAGRALARSAVQELLQSIDASGANRPLILGGFSQGGMLTTELIVNGCCSARAAICMSSSRLALSEWESHCEALDGLPALVSHGRSDPDLAFGAGLALRDWYNAAGACVTWVPFDGAHEAPLVVWRAIRHFVLDVIRLERVCPRVHGSTRAN